MLLARLSQLRPMDPPFQQSRSGRTPPMWSWVLPRIGEMLLLTMGLGITRDLEVVPHLLYSQVLERSAVPRSLALPRAGLLSTRRPLVLLPSLPWCEKLEQGHLLCFWDNGHESALYFHRWSIS